MESVTMVLYLSCDRICLAIGRPIYTSTLGLFEWYFFALSPSNYLITSFDQEILSIKSNFYNLPVCTSSLGSEIVLSHDLPGACPLRPPHQNFRPVAHHFAPLYYNNY